MLFHLVFGSPEELKTPFIMAAKKGGVLSTGTYDMKMLNKLSKVSDIFIWFTSKT